MINANKSLIDVFFGVKTEIRTTWNGCFFSMPSNTYSCWFRTILYMIFLIELNPYVKINAPDYVSRKICCRSSIQSRRLFHISKQSMYLCLWSEKKIARKYATRGTSSIHKCSVHLLSLRQMFVANMFPTQQRFWLCARIVRWTREWLFSWVMFSSDDFHLLGTMHLQGHNRRHSCTVVRATTKMQPEFIAFPAKNRYRPLSVKWVITSVPQLIQSHLKNVWFFFLLRFKATHLDNWWDEFIWIIALNSREWEMSAPKQPPAYGIQIDFKKWNWQNHGMRCTHALLLNVEHFWC